MKNLIIGLILSASSVSFAFAQEMRFEPDFEKKCFKEIEKLKCGSPDGKNEEVFMKCVDTKIAKLSSGCQEMHKAIKAESHSHDHDH